MVPHRPTPSVWVKIHRSNTTLKATCLRKVSAHRDTGPLRSSCGVWQSYSRSFGSCGLKSHFSISICKQKNVMSQGFQQKACGTVKWDRSIQINGIYMALCWNISRLKAVLYGKILMRVPLRLRLDLSTTWWW